MIDFCVDSQIPFSRDLVYATYRDKLLELGPHLPNVRSLRIKSRQETDHQVQLMIEWQGGGDIPTAARALLREELFTWTEYDIWDNNRFTVDWRIKTYAYPEAVFLAGKNHFLEQGKYTLVRNHGKVGIDLSAIHSLPPVLRQKLVHLVEDLLVKKIKPNLAQMGQHVQNYLDQTQKGQ